jgi:hypothetical protein
MAVRPVVYEASTLPVGSPFDNSYLSSVTASLLSLPEFMIEVAKVHILFIFRTSEGSQEIFEELRALHAQCLGVAKKSLQSEFYY